MHRPESFVTREAECASFIVDGALPAPRSRAGTGGPPPVHKVVITGTGRAGTTFLVRLLTELGLDTGFTADSWRKSYSEDCHAGLEWDILSPAAPYIVKNPALCETLPAVLATGNFVIDHAIVPVRDLEDAALSRVRVGGENGSVPGGLWKTADPAAQKGVLADAFHGLMLTLAEHEIPVTLVAFPRIVRDVDYARRKLGFLCPGVSPERFAKAYARIARPELVHRFPSPAVAPAPMPPAEVFARSVEASRRHRVRRRLRRVAMRYGIAAGFVAAAFGAWRIKAVRRWLPLPSPVHAISAAAPSVTQSQ